MTLNNKFIIADTVISLVKEGIKNNDAARIKEAFDMVDNPIFTWDGLDPIFLQWNELVDEANVILYNGWKLNKDGNN